VKLRPEIAVLVTALVVTSVLAGKYRVDTIGLEVSSDVKEVQSTYLSYQIQQQENVITQHESEIAQYESRVEEYAKQLGECEGKIRYLEDNIDFYKGEAHYWRSAYSGKVTGQVDRLLGYNEFSSLEELEQWLKSDPISEHKWHPNYDCDDFAIDLTLSALADGYWVGLGASDNHLFNFTIIGNDIYRIEAAHDEVEPWGVLD